MFGMVKDDRHRTRGLITCLLYTSDPCDGHEDKRQIVEGVVTRSSSDGKISSKGSVIRFKTRELSLFDGMNGNTHTWSVSGIVSVTGNAQRVGDIGLQKLFYCQEVVMPVFSYGKMRLQIEDLGSQNLVFAGKRCV